VVQPHPSSDLPPFGNQNSVSRQRLPIILIEPTRSVGAVVCAEASWECEFRGTLAMNRLVYLASLWVCLAAIQALGQEVVQSSPDRSPVQGAGSSGSVVPLPPASRPRPQPDTPAPPRGTTSAPVPDRAWPGPARLAVNRLARDLPRAAPRRRPRPLRQRRHWPSLARTSLPRRSPTVRLT